LLTTESLVQPTCIFICIVGILGFACESTCVLVFFGILDFLAFIFLGAIAILALVIAYYTSGKTSGNALSCNTNFTNLLKAFQVVDSFLIQADQTLCSTGCPCFINQNVQPQFTAYNAKTYLLWVQSPTGVFNFTSCSNATQQSAYTNAQNTYASSYNTTTNFSMSGLASAWSAFESDFNCTGFCQTNYTDSNGVTRQMMKFLFTNINNGVPQNIGCFNQILNWISKFTQAYGGIALTIAIFLFFLFILSCTWCCCASQGSDDGKGEIQMVSTQNK